MALPDSVRVTPATVRQSGTEAAELAEVGSTCRTTAAEAMSGCSSGWQTAAQPGFARFVELVHTQASRIRTDLTDIGTNLAAAADAYDVNEHHAADSLTLRRGGT